MEVEVVDSERTLPNVLGTKRQEATVTSSGRYRLS